MPITPTNPFKGRQFPGEVIILCVRWYLRYPLAYQHVAELLEDKYLYRAVDSCGQTFDFDVRPSTSCSPPNGILRGPSASSAKR